MVRFLLVVLLTSAFGVGVTQPASAATARPATQAVRHLAHVPSALRGGRRPAAPALPATNPPPGPTGYIPCDLWNAYHLPAPGDAAYPTQNGAGKLIAIIDPSDTIDVSNALSVFDSTFNIPAPHSLQTWPNPQPPPVSVSGGTPWATEIAIDVEWAHALAPAADIAVVYATGDHDTELLTAVDAAVNQLNADVVSMSWTVPEAPAANGLTWADIQSHDLHFPATNGAGRPVSYVAATGDDPSQPPNWPADSFRVAGVGGTSIPPPGFGYAANPGSPHTACSPTLVPGVEGRETDWQTSTTSGSQGGPSGQVPRPAYQTSSGNRAMPDVSMLANPLPTGGGVAVYEQGGWDASTQGGTSLSTAMWAGVLARADQVRAAAGLPDLRTTPIDSWVYDRQPSSFNVIVPPATNTGRGSPLWQNLVTDVQTHPSYTGYFSWYDNASPGVVNDNLHVVNPSPTTSVSVSVAIPGCASVVYSGPTAVPPRGEVYANCATPVTAGPVVVTGSDRVIASQRVEFNGSFNEVSAMSAVDADTTLYFTWYDHVSDAGFLGPAGDNIHVFNPSRVDGTVTPNIPGCPNLPAQALPHGGEVVFSCAGFGGPATFTADVPILGSQRVHFYSSFNEVDGMQLATSTVAGYLTWYDEASNPGFLPPGGDNVHVINPIDQAINVSVSIPGCRVKTATIQPGNYQYFSCAGGFGGPVQVSGDGRFLASARTRYYRSFNEVESMSRAQSGNTLFVPWFDRISSRGFVNDNLHVINVGASPATISANIPQCGTVSSQPTQTQPGQEAILTCPGGFGGPVIIQSDQLALAGQRVQFFQSFNEASASP